MSKNILVAYASRHGSTGEISNKIAEVLRYAGHQVSLRDVSRPIELDGYDAVIVGSSVYVGRWHKEAVQFLKENLETLAERKVWLFSSGPTGEGDPVELLKGWQYPDAIRPLLRQLNPEDNVVFHGCLEADNLSFMEKVAVELVHGAYGDFRDWYEITKWAAGIATALRVSVPRFEYAEF